MNKMVVAVMAAVLFIAGESVARGQNAIPSCYAAARLPVAAPRPNRAVFVLIDQTTALDQALRRTIGNNFNRLLEPGTTFTVATFSAFARGHHTTVLSSGAIEGPVPQVVRPSLPVRRLEALDRCLARQQQYARQVGTRALNRAIGVPATTFSNSEIMASLAQLSHSVRSAPSANRIVIIGSDLMEHSSASSFYARRNLRVINPRAELNNAIRLRLIGDFGKARIYAVGVGLLPAEAGTSVRDIVALNALNSFWTAWFTRSNARSVVIGRPDLVVPIR